MARTLDVYLHRKCVGHLIQDDGGQLTFSYLEKYVDEPDALALSHSLPLRKEVFSSQECRGFFSGILPEGEKRELIARNLGISAKNDFSMLEQIGGECAGAVTFMPKGEALADETKRRFKKLSDKELSTILKELPRRPLMAGEEGVRLSLAGAQDKLAVFVNESEIWLPLGFEPSTHILKPSTPHFEGVVYNEAFCMKLAEAVGLAAAKVEIRSVGGSDYLLVERYDRQEFVSDGLLRLKHKKRLHQEDFCQALGIVSEKKYQQEGGPSLKDCFDLLREVSREPLTDLQRLLDAVIFNYLVGNNDAHGKNFSLTHDGENTRFAPLYDVVCTSYYPEISKKMAMKIGGEYRSDLIMPLHFEKLADEAGLAKPLIKRRVKELAQEVLDNLENVSIDHPVARAVKKIIKKHSQDAVSQFGR